MCNYLAVADAVRAIRYDGLAEDGYNSNSFVSSLLIAKGGATAERDLEAMIAKGMNTPGPLRTNPNDHSVTDKMAADFTERQSERGKYSIPGLDHASIDPRRFSHDATVTAEPRPQRPIPQHRDIPAFLLLSRLLKRISVTSSATRLERR